MNTVNEKSTDMATDVPDNAMYIKLLRTVMEPNDTEYMQMVFFEAERVLAFLREGVNHCSLQEFLNEYTSEETTALLGYVLVHNEFALVYSGDEDEKFKVYGTPRDMNNFVLLCAEVFSGLLNENGFDDASRWMDALMDL